MGCGTNPLALPESKPQTVQPRAYSNYSSLQDPVVLTSVVRYQITLLPAAIIRFLSPLHQLFPPNPKKFDMDRTRSSISRLLAVILLTLPVIIQAVARSHNRNDQIVPPVSQSGYQVPISNGELPQFFYPFLMSCSPEMINCAKKFTGSTSLSAPPADDCLEAIALAYGTQEYSCVNSSNVTSPDHTGAIATLYDVASLVPFLPDEQSLHELPAYFLNYNYREVKNSSLKVLGHHYYVDSVPTFDLGSMGLFQIRIDLTINAPQDPSVNIGWVCGVSLDGMRVVYRVETAGGTSPPTCGGQNATFSVPYSAEYWFYKPG